MAGTRSLMVFEWIIMCPCFGSHLQQYLGKMTGILFVCLCVFVCLFVCLRLYIFLERLRNVACEGLADVFEWMDNRSIPIWISYSVRPIEDKSPPATH